MNRLKLTAFLPANNKFHLARVTHSAKFQMELHDHDFPEIIWVEKGRGTHHINGQKVRIHPGMIIFIRPYRDKHTLRSYPLNGQLTVGVIAFSAKGLGYLKSRYFPNANRYFWTEDKLPHHFQMDEETQCWLSDYISCLMLEKKNNLNLDRFLLSLFTKLEGPEEQNEYRELPGWLYNALKKYQTPIEFNGGPEHFAGMAKRSREHINRVLKKHLDLTLSEVLNKERIRYAARQLVLMDTAIGKIAADAGFDNLGYFYKVFKHHYHVSPGEYRKLNKSIG